MKLLTILFIFNAALLLIHEIESAYEKEWQILNLPFGINGFLIIHIPIILVLFYGALEIDKQSYAGLVLGIITGAGGIIPFLVHKILVRRKDHFNSLISNVIIYLNIILGILIIILSSRILY
jgi:hypothetical protein